MTKKLPPSGPKIPRHRIVEPPGGLQVGGGQWPGRHPNKRI